MCLWEKLCESSKLCLIRIFLIYKIMHVGNQDGKSGKLRCYYLYIYVKIGGRKQLRIIIEIFSPNHHLYLFLLYLCGNLSEQLGILNSPRHMAFCNMVDMVGQTPSVCDD